MHSGSCSVFCDVAIPFPPCVFLKNQTQNKREIVMLTTGLASCLCQDICGLNWLQLMIWASQAQARIHQRPQPHVFFEFNKHKQWAWPIIYGSGGIRAHILLYLCVWYASITQFVSSIRTHNTIWWIKTVFMQALLIVALLSLTIARLIPETKQNAASEVMQKQDN